MTTTIHAAATPIADRPVTGGSAETVRRLFDAFRAGDRSTLHLIMSPDIEWVQAAGFPGGATHRGPDAVTDVAFGRLAREWATWRAVVHETLDFGDTVIVLGEYHGTHRATGRSVVAPFAHVYRLREGRIVRFEQHTDTKLIADAYRPLVAPAADGPLACVPDAIPAAERRAHAERATRLFGEQAREREALTDGYAYRFDVDALADLARWITNERLCCPFLRFALDLLPGGDTIELALTGPPGTRAFLDAELPARRA